MCKT
ncbi:hypothetical protein D043_2330A, partial [Vibrio parahaemolyticus EKP-021]